MAARTPSPKRGSDYDFLFKIAVFGDEHDQQALIEKYMGFKINQHDMVVHREVVDGYKIKNQLFSVSETDKRNVFHQGLRVPGAIITFDYTVFSFDWVKMVHKEIERYGHEDIQVVLVGTNFHKLQDEDYSSMVEKWAKTHNIKLFNVLEGTDVDDIFVELDRMMMEIVHPKKIASPKKAASPKKIASPKKVASPKRATTLTKLQHKQFLDSLVQDKRMKFHGENRYTIRGSYENEGKKITLIVLFDLHNIVTRVDLPRFRTFLEGVKYKLIDNVPEYYLEPKSAVQFFSPQ